ncbi:MAG TPA: hypothetical protein VJ103_01720 [Candidatus Paceibacterota bacterium]|nr:hypothetical protein [Candidatus Paceibacterota bacterium]
MRKYERAKIKAAMKQSVAAALLKEDDDEPPSFNFGDINYEEMNDCSPLSKHLRHSVSLEEELELAVPVSETIGTGLVAPALFRLN